MMRIAAALLLASLAPAACLAEEGDYEVSTTVLPAARMEFGGEGLLHSQARRNSFEGVSQPVYRLELRKRTSGHSAWGVGLWHAGRFGGGGTGTETVEGYQTADLNPGFTNFFLTHYRNLAGLSDVELLLNFSIVRQINIRKEIRITGYGHDGGINDTSESSAEGIGVGLQGRHGDPYFLRWRAAANHYIQLFDADTDSDAGQLFNAEIGVGRRFGAFSVELGGLYQYWFIRQEDRLIFVENTPGAMVSWASQELRAHGAYFRLAYRY